MGDRCTGHCCRYFSVGPPEEAAAQLNRLIARGGDSGDAQKVKDLLIYRGYFTNPLNEDQEPEHWYTCKHFVVDEEYDGHCAIYEERPMMCRKYPNGEACAYAKTGCSWDWAHRPQRRSIDVPVHRLLWKKRVQWLEVARTAAPPSDAMDLKPTGLVDLQPVTCGKSGFKVPR